MEEHMTLIDGLEKVFSMQCDLVIDETKIYPHLRSATEHPKVIEDLIEKEVAAGRYLGPFQQHEVEEMLGPFVANPLGTVKKASGGYRVIEHLSFSNSDTTPSVNEKTNIENIETNWFGIAEMIDLIIKAPEGAQGATVDWENAFRNCPIRQEDWKYGVFEWNGKLWIDLAAKFGAKSSTGIFELPNRAFVIICVNKGYGIIIYWVDDLMVCRIPIRKDGDKWVYDTTIDDIVDLASDLGIRLPAEKIQDFSDKTTYIGFVWHWEEKAVSVTEKKRNKTRELANDLLKGDHSISHDELESLCGKFAHLGMVVAKARAHTRGLWRTLQRWRKRVSHRNTSNENSQKARRRTWIGG